MQNRLPCFIPRLDTTSTRYLVISLHKIFLFLILRLVSIFSLHFGNLSLILQHQVPVAHGERLEGDKVADTCEKSGMKAVCAGDEGCRWNNVSR